MSARPTGRLAHHGDGVHLLLDRLFSAPIEDVWYSITNPTAMSQWIGTYTGDPKTGGVKFIMSAEPDAQWEYVTIRECAPPHRFLAESGEEGAKMRVYCHLRESGGMTTLTLGQRVDANIDVADWGPGWDYYLDRLMAARAGAPLPAFETYHPAFCDYYRALVAPDTRETRAPIS
jgi:uncharacterized protein YndB with AHSA1/START domain